MTGSVDLRGDEQFLKSKEQSFIYDICYNGPLDPDVRMHVTFFNTTEQGALSRGLNRLAASMVVPVGIQMMR